MKNHWLIYGGLIFAMAVWSYSYVLIKIVYDYGMPPTMLVFFRLIIAATTLIIFSKITGKLQRIQPKDRRLFFFLAVFEPFLYYIGESNGLMYVTPTVGSIIIATIPVFTPFILYLYFREKIDRTNFIGIAISFIGVLMVILDDQYRLTASPKGLAFMFFAVFSALGYTVIIKRLTERYNSITIVAMQTTIGAIIYTPMFMFSDFDQILTVSYTWDMFLFVALLAIFSTTIAYIFFSSGIREIGATKATIFANLIPVLTALMALLSGMESLPMRKLSGVLVVIAGVFLSQSKKPFLGIPELLASYFSRKNDN